MAGSDYKWVPLAKVFPAGLDTDTDPARLADGFSPDAYGMDIDHPGFLYPGVAPSPSSPITKTYTISSVPWSWFFRRLWRSNGANLEYGAPEYTSIYFAQGLGKLSFDEDSESIVTFFPFAHDAMFVGKATGGYIVPNASSDRGDYQHTDIVPAMKVSAAANAVELDGTAYVSNASGLFAWDGGPVVEVSANVRAVLSRLAALPLKRDEAKRRLCICVTGGATTGMVYDPKTKKIYDYTQSGFRFTSRTLVDPRNKPFTIRSLAMQYVNTAQDDVNMRYQVQLDEDWQDEMESTLRYTTDARAFFSVPMARPYEARQFRLRITGMDSGAKIRQINVDTNVTSDEESWAK